MSSALSAAAPDLFDALFDLSLTGSVLYDPVRDASGAVVDFRFNRLNPVAQDLLQLPAQVEKTYLGQFPTARTTGAFDFHRAAFESDAARHFEQHYQADGYDHFLRIAARRVGEQLLVSFTNTSEQSRAAIEQALRDSQTQAQQAQAAAEAERLRLHQMLMRMPANIALLRGPEHIYDLVNPEYELLFPARTTLGRSIREVIPEIVGQGFYELFDRVYQTGEPFYEPETEAWADFAGTGELQRRYYRTTFEPIRNAQGEVTEVLNFAVDVTAQVEARQQVEQLNHELEARVRARTQELESARETVERERRQWERLFWQAPAAICIFDGPEWVYQFVNPGYQAMFPGQALLGKRLLDIFPELASQALPTILRRVYNSGEPFIGTEVLVPLARTAGGPVENIYFDLTYQARRNEAGQIDGLFTYAHDVTERVLARRQIETLQAAALAAAQRRVQQREELYQVFAQTPAAISLTRGPEHRYVYLNEACEALFAGRQLLGQAVADALPEAEAQGLLALLDQVYATGETFSGTEVPLSFVGENSTSTGLRYFNFTYQAYREDDQVVGIATFAYEVTAQVLARQREVEQARQFRELYEQAPMAVTILRGPEFIVELANPAILHIWGLTAEESLGRPRLELLPETSRASLRAVLETAYRTRQTHHVQEFPVVLGRARSGQPDLGYFNFIYQPLFDEQGAPLALTCVGIEVTEQVLARQAVEANAQRLRLLTDALPVLIGYLDREERYQFTNEAYRGWFGQDPAALLGRTVREVVGEKAYANAKPYIDRALAGERLDFESHMPNRAGFVKHIRTSYLPDVLAGELRGFYTLASDITEQVEARQQVEQLNQELEARVQERTREVQEAQTAAERERALLQALLTQAPVAIGLFQGEEIRVTAANSMMAAIWGYTPEQVVGRLLVEGVPELRGQGFDEMLRQVLRTQVPITGTATPAVMLRDGELKTTYYNFVYQPLYDAEGQVLGVIDVALEVTEQVEARRRIEQLAQEAQAARAEAERQRGELERVFEEAPVAIAVYRGPNYTIELANPTVARLWGRTREQLLGKGLFEALPEVAGMGYEALLDGVMATGVPHVAHAMEAQHDRNGQRETVYWDFVYVPMYEADGRISGAMVVATEVTAQVLARRQVEQLNHELEARVQERTRQLSEQQAVLRQILGQVPASIATLSGPEHRYTFFNELYQSLSAGRTELALSVAEVFPEVVAQGFVDLLDQVYATGEPFIGTDMPALLYDAVLGRNRQYYVDFIYQPLFDAQRRVQGILAFILDVTDRAQARQLVEESQLQVQELNQELASINEELRTTNEELHSSNTRLTRTNVDLDTFVYTASHDLKAPITNIEGILQALRETLPPEVQQDEVVGHILGLLDHTVSRFLVTIDQLTDLTRLQQSYDAPAERLALAPIVAGVVEDLAPTIAAAAAQVHLTVPEGLAVSFAPASLRSIIYNLLSNAVKYRDAARPAQVWLHAERRATTVVLTVRDNGLGLSPSQQTRLFGVFQRLHTHVEGTGVGLYMIKRLIDNAGASITVTSTLGVGSTFTVTFPV